MNGTCRRDHPGGARGPPPCPGSEMTMPRPSQLVCPPPTPRSNLPSEAAHGSACALRRVEAANRHRPGATVETPLPNSEKGATHPNLKRGLMMREVTRGFQDSEKKLTLRR